MKKAAVTRALEEFIARRKQQRLIDLMGKLEWDLYLLVVDCLYDDGPVKKAEQRPGRLVLKPKKVFTDRELFNGLCDVMNMELLCKAHMVCEAERPVLCTMDHGMAQAWAMFGPYDMRFEDGKPAFHIGMDDSFAIRMSPQRRHRFFSDLFSTDSS